MELIGIEWHLANEPRGRQVVPTLVILAVFGEFALTAEDSGCFPVAIAGDEFSIR